MKGNYNLVEFSDKWDQIRKLTSRMHSHAYRADELGNTLQRLYETSVKRAQTKLDIALSAGLSYENGSCVDLSHEELSALGCITLNGKTYNFEHVVSLIVASESDENEPIVDGLNVLQILESMTSDVVTLKMNAYALEGDATIDRFRLKASELLKNFEGSSSKIDEMIETLKIGTAQTSSLIAAALAPGDEPTVATDNSSAVFHWQASGQLTGITAVQAFVDSIETDHLFTGIVSGFKAVWNVLVSLYEAIVAPMLTAAMGNLAECVNGRAMKKVGSGDTCAVPSYIAEFDMNSVSYQAAIAHSCSRGLYYGRDSHDSFLKDALLFADDRQDANGTFMLTRKFNDHAIVFEYQYDRSKTVSTTHNPWVNVDMSGNGKVSTVTRLITTGRYFSAAGEWTDKLRYNTNAIQTQILSVFPSGCSEIGLTSIDFERGDDAQLLSFGEASEWGSLNTQFGGIDALNHMESMTSSDNMLYGPGILVSALAPNIDNDYNFNERLSVHLDIATMRNMSEFPDTVINTIWFSPSSSVFFRNYLNVATRSGSRGSAAPSLLISMSDGKQEKVAHFQDLEVSKLYKFYSSDYVSNNPRDIIGVRLEHTTNGTVGYLVDAYGAIIATGYHCPNGIYNRMKQRVNDSQYTEPTQECVINLNWNSGLTIENSYFSFGYDVTSHFAAPRSMFSTMTYMLRGADLSGDFLYREYPLTDECPNVHIKSAIFLRPRSPANLNDISYDADVTNFLDSLDGDGYDRVSFKSMTEDYSMDIPSRRSIFSVQDGIDLVDSVDSDESILLGLANSWQSLFHHEWARHYLTTMLHPETIARVPDLENPYVSNPIYSILGVSTADLVNDITVDGARINHSNKNALDKVVQPVVNVKRLENLLAYLAMDSLISFFEIHASELIITRNLSLFDSSMELASENEYYLAVATPIEEGAPIEFAYDFVTDEENKAGFTKLVIKATALLIIAAGGVALRSLKSRLRTKIQERSHFAQMARQRGDFKTAAILERKSDKLQSRLAGLSGLKLPRNSSRDQEEVDGDTALYEKLTNTNTRLTDAEKQLSEINNILGRF